MGLEPIVSAWKADRLPLTDTRKNKKVKTKISVTRTTKIATGSTQGRRAGHLPMKVKKITRLRKRRVRGRKTSPLDLEDETRLKESTSRASPFGPKNSSRPRSLC